MSMNAWAIAGGVLLLGIVLVYNALVRRRNAVDNAFAAIDAYLMMRYELIPNLVETVKGYARHEQDTLRRVVELRREALAGTLGTDARVRLDNRIAGDVRSLFALGESYPALKASENFAQLQRALNEVEERISAARRAFNAAVLEYNNAVDVFPLSLVARVAGFARRAFFETPGEARANVVVS